MNGSKCFNFVSLILVVSLFLGEHKQAFSGELPARPTRFDRPGPYNVAVGVCYGLNPGLTFKKFLAEESAFEIIAASRWKGYTLTGYYELCVGSAERGKDIFWNIGMGPRVGFFEGKYYKDFVGSSREDRMYSVIGIAGIFGFEHYFGKIPFSIAFDYRPYFDLKGKDDSLIDGAISLRFVFK